MPYVKPEERGVIYAQTPGQLNYQITTLVDRYIKNKGGISYSNINEVVGVIECVKLELYRRIASPYEDKKIQENGDVYTDYNETKDSK